MSRPSIADKRRGFHELHASGCFVIPNPWDVGSALLLQSLGFRALASTSSGFAWSCGQADGSPAREQVLTHLHTLVDATDVPVNADFMAGFAHDPDGVAASVTLAVETGVAGLSIEDSTGDPERPLYDLETATLRLRAARRAIDRNGGDTLLVGRAECFLFSHPSLEETIARLQSYAHAGADCLYAPGLASRVQIEAVVRALAPKPVNVLIGSASGLSVAQAAAMGVRRISVGGSLARVAWGALMRAARLLAEQGSFAGFADGADGRELNRLFGSLPRPDAGPTPQ
jgi:2-methylisocitrate lyase-like PEP mutase family enzyme